ncbi:MAG: DUF2934 domain-containing protein [Chthoniobacteraceae bacterium]
MKALPQPKPEPTKDEIALAAYYIWEERGCPAGDGAEFWLEAEERLRGAANIVPFEL